MTAWRSYPKIYNVGHAAVRDVFLENVLIEEKIDGSQFSFGFFDGALKVRSKGKEQYPATDKMFLRGVEVVEGLIDKLQEGWMYSGEYLSKPKHNTLSYSRTPKQNIILFDIRTGEEQYLTYEEKAKEAERLGLEVVPILHQGKVTCLEDLTSLMDRESILGEATIEGFVVKNYERFTKDGKAMLAKHVSEAFKETNSKDFRKRNPSKGDIIDMLCTKYRSEARWEKAAQHLRDNGQLLGEPKDIGNLIKEAQRDLKEEEESEIKETLFKHFWSQISRKSVAGLPEWYKTKLMESAFFLNNRRQQVRGSKSTR